MMGPWEEEVLSSMEAGLEGNWVCDNHKLHTGDRMGLVSEEGDLEVLSSRGSAKVSFEDFHNKYHWQAGALLRMGVDMAGAQGTVVLVAWSMGSLSWTRSIGQGCCPSYGNHKICILDPPLRKSFCQDWMVGKVV